MCNRTQILIEFSFERILHLFRYIERFVQSVWQLMQDKCPDQLYDFLIKQLSDYTKWQRQTTGPGFLNQVFIRNDAQTYTDFLSMFRLGKRVIPYCSAIRFWYRDILQRFQVVWTRGLKQALSAWMRLLIPQSNGIDKHYEKGLGCITPRTYIVHVGSVWSNMGKWHRHIYPLCLHGCLHIMCASYQGNLRNIRCRDT